MTAGHDDRLTPDERTRALTIFSEVYRLSAHAWRAAFAGDVVHSDVLSSVNELTDCLEGLRGHLRHSATVRRQRSLLLRDSCADCLHARHAACTGRRYLLGGPCECAIGEHAELLALPATMHEIPFNLRET